MIELLEDQQLDQVLNYIRYPEEFYAGVLHRLIAEKIVNVDGEWRSFINHLRQSITKAAAVRVDKGRAQTFVVQLRKEFLEGYLQNETLGSVFVIDCSDEYEDCDNEETKEFQKTCLKEFELVSSFTFFTSVSVWKTDATLFKSVKTSSFFTRYFCS